MRVSNPFFWEPPRNQFDDSRLSQTSPTARTTPVEIVKPVNVSPWFVDLVAYWKADGNLLDSSGNGLDLSRILAFSPPPASYGTGKIGAAYDFDGTAGYGNGRTTADSVFNLSGDFTISFWVNFNDVAPTFSNNAILSNFDLGDGFPNWSGWVIYADNNVGGVYLRDGINAVGYYGATFTTSTWYHVVIYRSGSDVWIYLNGSGLYANIYPNPFKVSTQPLYVGMGFGGGTPLNGRLDEIAIWTRALSVSEIGDLYNGGSGFSLV